MPEQVNFRELITNKILAADGFVEAVFSGKLLKGDLPWIRVSIRLINIRSKMVYQFAYRDERKDITKNFPENEARLALQELLSLPFRHFNVISRVDSIQVSITKKGKALLSRTKLDQSRDIDFSHNKKKSYIVSPDTSEKYLNLVGITNQDGQVKPSMYNKLRQVNEFVKVLAKAIEECKFEKTELRLVDLGCGNAYLTFAAYHYLNNLANITTHVTGVDVRSEPLYKHIENIKALGWEFISFQQAPILEFQPSQCPDIVLALHACDTATDDALAQAIRWTSDIIICSPCCHHDLQKQLEKAEIPTFFQAVFRYNTLSERLGDILTDAFRGLILRVLGYQVDIIQFVETEHTAKNVLIRAVKTPGSANPVFIKEFKEMKKFWGVQPYLETLLNNQGISIE